MTDVYIFGRGSAAEVAKSLIDASDEHRFVNYCLDAEYIGSSSTDVIAYDAIPRHSSVFVAMGYTDLNRHRAKIVDRVKTDGHKLINVGIDLCGFLDIELGLNNLILPDSSIQPKAKIGTNVFIWSGSVVCHHSVIGDHVWLTAGSVIAGNTRVGSRIFVGANSTIASGLSVGDNVFIRAGVYIDSDIPNGSVDIRCSDKPSAVNADDFIKFLDSRGY